MGDIELEIPGDTTSGRLDPKDATFWLSSRDGMPTDQYFLLAFAGGGLDAEAVARHIDARIEATPALRKRLVDSPGGLDYPVWVAQRLPHADTCTALIPSSPTWSATLDAVARVLSGALDAQVSPWQLHVGTDIEGVPGVDGPATVVLVRFSHALTDGAGGAALVRAMFAVTPEPGDTAVAGIAAAATRSRAVTALGDLGRGLVRGLRLPGGLISAMRAGRRMNARIEVATTTVAPALSYSAAPGPHRHLSVIPIDLDRLRRSGFTVTETALAAISLAMQRYAEERGEDPSALGAHVTVAVDKDTAWHGENRFLPALISLSANVTPPDRAAAIRSSLRRERARLRDPDMTSMVRLAEVVPRPILTAVSRRSARDQRSAGRRAARGAGTAPTVHTSFTSLRCGDGQLSVGDAPLALIAGFPVLSSHVGVGHGLYGAGPMLTLSVLSAPENIVERDRYRELLTEALAEI
ncbi:wax ester/triacylglycerol synthase domain-containing protein [Williamsia sp. CHRR-6]|uniref:wax ester/triacylglycerol synthase domain-containing protein n=1 Tax=Williamsia sp. CHRR-6 TaxID=2835871 RepID=UPI001BDAB64C|nr:wax ester/triacylglycerol synthase domain-containing protein [Williamsia sp. CHRR-6]MBT0567389.1 hypothetical protein [Williamsia sp. CHRR-6]